MFGTGSQQSPHLDGDDGPGVQELQEQLHVDVDGGRGGAPDRIFVPGGC